MAAVSGASWMEAGVKLPLREEWKSVGMDVGSELAFVVSADVRFADGGTVGFEYDGGWGLSEDELSAERVVGGEFDAAGDHARQDVACPALGEDAAIHVDGNGTGGFVHEEKDAAIGGAGGFKGFVVVAHPLDLGA